MQFLFKEIRKSPSKRMCTEFLSAYRENVEKNASHYNINATDTTDLRRYTSFSL